ncbi:RNA polymerase sigma factor [Actinokineospora sp.]|uniref:RNA polymerase sigma factor n=1 Tax=Actinokineospora sp. TaxID=1872133 RepID=UPI004037E9F6
MDEVAVRRAQARPADASLAALYREHRLGLVRLAVLLIGEQAAAEDAVQDVFAVLWRRGFVPETPAYLRTAVVNRCRSTIRRAVLARRRVAPEVVAGPAPGDRVELAEEHQEVLDAIDGLPRRQREVVVLRYYAELPVAEVARTLGIHEGTVKSTCARALSTLRHGLGEKS